MFQRCLPDVLCQILLNYLDRGDDRLIRGGDSAVAVGGLSLCRYFVNDLHALCHHAEGGVFAVEEGAVLMNDKELGACAVKRL